MNGSRHNRPRALLRTATAAALLAVFFLGAPLTAVRAADPNDSNGAEYESQAAETAKTQANEKTARAPTQVTPVQCAITEIACGVLMVLNWIADMGIFLVFPLAETFFNGVLAANTSFSNPASSFLVAAHVGSRIVLGTVNMFFVLLLLWIAIATIFDFEMFSAKRLLPRLIIAALLINFSFAIGRAIIVLSNGIGQIFVQQIDKRGGVGRAIVSITDPVLITKAVQNKYTSLSKEEAAGILRNSVTTIHAGVNILGFIIPGPKSTYSALECYDVVYGGLPFIGSTLQWLYGGLTQSQTYLQCSALLDDVEVARALTSLDPTHGKTTLLAGAFAAKALIAPIALFVLFAAGVMLLIRLISLMGLLIFAPFAFFAFMVPGMQGYWSGWWDKLFKWSFFLPAFLFLFMISLLVFRGIPNATQDLILNGKAVPDFASLFVQYLVGIGLMIFSLMVGQQMSIYGASTVTSWGKGLAGATGKWTRGTGKILGGGVAGAILGSAAGQALARTPYARGLLRPIEAARAVGQKVSDDRDKAALRRRGLAAKVSPDYRRSIMQGMAPSERANFVRDMKEHEIGQLLGVMTPQDRIDLYRAMKKFNLAEKVRDAAQDLKITALVEMETGTAHTAANFQDSFNNWLASATTGDIQKRVSAEDISSDTHLQQAIATQGVIDLNDLRAMANTGEKSEAMRQHFIDLGGRTSFDTELTLGFTKLEASERAILRAVDRLRPTNPELARQLTGSPVVLNLARSLPLGRKSGPAVVVVPQTQSPTT